MVDVYSLHNLSFSGFTLSVEERAVLETAMAERRLAEGLERIGFWGKIFAEEADYLVVCGTPLSAEYPHKKFYACTSRRVDLQAFPDMTEEFVAKSAAQKGPFKGDPTLVLEEVEDDDADADDDGSGEPKPRKVRFSELHRLAFVVGEIDRDCAVVPRGAFTITPTHYVAENSGFRGLTATEAADPAQYLHFRKPEALARRSVLERRALVEDVDFLDPISEDSPRGVWSLRVDLATARATARSLLWPGYFFFHNIETPAFGGCYFGDGQKNADLAFML